MFPRCEASPQQCEAHHLVPWHRGGETALHNGALLCPHHHKIVEPYPHALEGSRWSIALDHRGLPHIFPPTRVDPERKPRQHTRFRQRGHPELN
ncbi:MAG: HNH endonuclease signature motif containing protein [Propionibacteriaceae bacterium]